MFGKYKISSHTRVTIVILVALA
ncbi:MAG: hypothetical protein JWO96_5, partial [Candidatus Saccharibacteria bacterium]|nr:hypothetical protein [Candidatus Saccharibacteria bacterium]